MKFSVVAPSDCGNELISAWRRLLDRASNPSIFLSPEWSLAWWRAYGSGREPLMLIASDSAGEVEAVAPLYRRRLGAGLGPRVVGVMGDREGGAEYLGILALPGREAAAVSVLLDSLRRSTALLDFRGIREGDILTALIADEPHSPRPERTHRERHLCLHVPLPDDYERYLASLKPKFRTTLRYRTNKLVKNYSVRLLRTKDAEELPESLDRLFHMHQARWIAEGHRGSFFDPRKQAFYRDMAAGFLRAGWLRFHHLEVDGVIRASQFGFAHGGVFHSLQEGFDTSFQAPGVGGIGVVLRGMVIRECIGEALRSYDFLGGGQDYKVRWGAEPHFVERIRIASSRLEGKVAFALAVGIESGWRRIRMHLPGPVRGLRESWKSRGRRERTERADIQP